MYKYLGDRLTDIKFKGATCKAVRRNDGKCIRGRGSMLVEFEDKKVVVIARLLRKQFNQALPLPTFRACAGMVSCGASFLNY